MSPPCSPLDSLPGVFHVQGASPGRWRYPPVLRVRPKAKGHLWALPPLNGAAAAAKGYEAARRGEWDRARWWLDRAGAWWALSSLKDLAPQALRELGEGTGRWDMAGIGLPSPSAALAPTRVRLLTGVAGARYGVGDDPWLVGQVLALPRGGGRDQALTYLAENLGQGHREKAVHRLVEGLNPAHESALVAGVAIRALRNAGASQDAERWGRGWWDGPAGAKATTEGRAEVARQAGLAAARAGSFSRARRWFAAAVAASATEATRNSLAWLALFDGGDLKRALALTDGLKAPNAVHTRATILAALGRPAAAMSALLPLVKRRFEPHHLLVLGRVAQELGLWDTARSYYARAVPRDDVERGDPTSSTALAGRWAETLPPASKAPRRGARRRWPLVASARHTEAQ